MYSLITAAILFVLGLVLGQDLDHSTREVLGYVSIVISLLFVFYGIKHFRDKVNDGVVSFKQALILGMLISIFAGIGVALVDVIYTSVINPDFYEEYKTAMREQGYEGEIPEMSSAFMAFIMFATVLIIGFVISLLSALILQRKN